MITEIWLATSTTQIDYAMSDLHDDLDEFALTIEKQIKQNEERLEELPEFDSKYRRMEEARKDENTEDLFA